MKLLKVTFNSLFCFGMLAITLSSFAPAKPSFGLDTFAVYLNEKLILKQAVNEPISLQSLQLGKANASDRLVIYYSQCNVENKVGKSRVLAIKNAKGHTVREWKFADSKTGESVMTISVRDLLQMDKTLAMEELHLFYAAEGKTDPQKLLSLQVRI